MTRAHPVTVLENLSTLGEVWSATFEEYGEFLEDPPSGRVALVWGATFANERRTNANCMGRSILAIDIDGDHGILTCQEAIERAATLGVRAMAHTTQSHMRSKGNRPACPRIRVLVELSEAVPNDKAWKTIIWPWVQQHWPEHDASGKDIARFSWAPRAAEGYEHAAIEGAPLDWRAGLSVPAGSQAASDAPVWQGTVYPFPTQNQTYDLIRRLAASWPKSGRHFTHMAVSGWLAKRGFPCEFVRTVVCGVCEATNAADRIPNRLAMVDSTFDKLAAGGFVSGADWLHREAPHVLVTLDAFETMFAARCLGRLAR